MPVTSARGLLLIFTICFLSNTADAGIRDICFKLFGQLFTGAQLARFFDFPKFDKDRKEILGRRRVLLDIRDLPQITKTNFAVGSHETADALSVGLTNPTVKLLNIKTIAGEPVEEIEARMRPGDSDSHRQGRSSQSGVLGKSEKLREVLASDNAFVVDRLGLTHQRLAEPLEYVCSLVKYVGRTWGRPERIYAFDFSLGGRRYRVDIDGPYAGYQFSPFKSDSDKSFMNYTVTNLDTGKSLSFSMLMPALIGKYGFYEGRGTKYRVEPRQIIEVFDYLKPEDHKEKNSPK